jgi:hypothetical protein
MVGVSCSFSVAVDTVFFEVQIPFNFIYRSYSGFCKVQVPLRNRFQTGSGLL